MVGRRLCRHILFGFLLGFASAGAIWAAQRAAHQPSGVTLPGMFVLGGCGALVGWLLFRFRDRACPRCGHAMGKGNVYSTEEPTHSWLDTLSKWDHRSSRIRRGVALYNCDSCGAVYRLVGIDGLAMVHGLAPASDPVEAKASTSVRSEHLQAEIDRAAPFSSSSSQRDRLFFLRHRVFWANVAALLSAIFLLWIGAKTIRDGAASIRWASVAGRAVNSEVIETEGKRSTRRAQMTYEYEVEGTTYRGSRISFGAIDDGSAQQLAARHPIGATMHVYYAPDDPQRSVLEPGVTFGGVALVFLGCFLVLLIVGLPLWKAGRRDLAVGTLCLIGGFACVITIPTADRSHATFVARQERQQRKQSEAAHQTYLRDLQEEQHRVQGTRWVNSRFSSSISFDEEGAGEIINGTAVEFGFPPSRTALRYTQQDGWLTMVLESGGSIKAQVQVLDGELIMFMRMTPTGRDADGVASLLRAARFTRGDP